MNSNQLKCDICDQETFLLKCSDCSKNNILCENCFNYKHNSALMKKHKIEIPKKNEMKIGRIEFHFPTELTCEIHQEKKAHSLCQDCYKEVCSLCLSENLHKGHTFINFTKNIIEIKEIFNKEYESFYLLKKISQETKNNYCNKLIEFIHEVEKYKAFVNEVFQNSLTALVREKSLILNSVDQYQRKIFSFVHRLFTKARTTNKRLNEKLPLVQEIRDKELLELGHWKWISQNSMKAVEEKKSYVKFNDKLQNFIYQKEMLPKTGNDIFIQTNDFFKNFFEKSFKELNNFFASSINSNLSSQKNKNFPEMKESCPNIDYFSKKAINNATLK